MTYNLADSLDSRQAFFGSLIEAAMLPNPYVRSFYVVDLTFNFAVLYALAQTGLLKNSSYYQVALGVNNMFL